MADPGDGNVFSQIKIVRDEMGVQIQMLQHGLQFLPQPVDRFLVSEFIMQLDFTF